MMARAGSVFKVTVACPLCATETQANVHVYEVRLDALGQHVGTGQVVCVNESCRNDMKLQVTLPQPSQAPPPPQVPQDAPQMSAGEQELSNDAAEQELAADIFGDYVCQSLRFGRTHPADNITESASMCSCPLPPATYPLQDSLGRAQVIDDGRLSSLQLEGVLYAGQRHCRFLPGRPERHGFFLGDGAGVGKGRQISGVILDNFMRGRRKHFWFSVTSDLRLDAERDLGDIGAHGVKVINGCKGLDKGRGAFGFSSDLKDGVLFSTYATLVSAVQSGSSRGMNKRQRTRRIEQLVEWAGGSAFDGCLVFDECHKAKNYSDKGGDKGTKVGAAVVELQKLLPRARVLYCSATGVTDVEHMAYMERLGLWGTGTQFAAFSDFHAEFSKRGVGALEMLSIEMKASGTFVSRALGFRSATFETNEAELRGVDIRSYDAAVQFWNRLRSSLQEAMAKTNAKNTVMRMFWSGHQRFFKQLCISIKVPTIAAQVEAALAAGQCAVIGLQTTGESALNDFVSAQPKSWDGSLPTMISNCQFILTSFIESHFPTEAEVVVPAAPPAGVVMTQRLSDGSAIMSDGSYYGSDGTYYPLNPVATAGAGAAGATKVATVQRVQEMVDLKAALLKEAAELVLPPAPLDDLIDRLGGPSHVCEMTGRKGRLVRIAPDAAPVQYELRAHDEEERECLNVRECRRFQAGECLVAIISDAASTGISLHASTTAANQRRRVHITMEMPWSADKAIQQLGRSHRSGQASAPDYRLVISKLAGEKRFASSVARRLESLGALTRGDRRAATGADLSAFNFETKYGRAALKKLLMYLSFHQTCPVGVDLAEVTKGSPLEGFPAAQVHEALREKLLNIGLLAAGESIESVPVSKFLNRLLGVEVALQNALFCYYSSIFDHDILVAKRTGTYNEGVSDIRGTVRQAAPPVHVYKSDALGIETTLHTLNVDRGITWEQAMELYNNALVSKRAQEASGGGGSGGGSSDDGEDLDDLEDFIDDGEDDGDGGAQQSSSSRTGFYRSKQKMFGEYCHILCISRRTAIRSMAIQSRPNTGTNSNPVNWFDVTRLYTKYDLSDPVVAARAQRDWEEEWRRGAPKANAKSKREHGKRTYSICMLTGAVTPFWSTLEAFAQAYPELGASKDECSLQVVRVNLTDDSDTHSAAAAAAASGGSNNSGAASGGPRRIVGIKWPHALGTKISDVSGRLEIIDRLHSAAKGKEQGVRPAEPPAQVDTSATKKALTKPRTLHNFFSGGGGSSSAGGRATAPAASASASASVGTDNGGGGVPSSGSSSRSHVVPALPSATWADAVAGSPMGSARSNARSSSSIGSCEDDAADLTQVATEPACQLPCPRCTLLNDSGARACAACATPFAKPTSSSGGGGMQLKQQRRHSQQQKPPTQPPPSQQRTKAAAKLSGLAKKAGQSGIASFFTAGKKKAE